MKHLYNTTLNLLGDIVVVAYDPGRFLTSLEIGLVNMYKNEYFTLGQEIVDKSGIQIIANCSLFAGEVRIIFHCGRGP